MSHPLSLHQLVALEVSPAALVRIAASLGCAHVCLFTRDPKAGIDFPVVEDADMDAVLAAMASEGVTAYGAASFAVARDLRIDDFAPALARAARLGVSCATVRLIETDDARAVDQFAAFAALARQFDIHAGIEFMGYGNVDALPRALRIIAAAGVGGVAVDALHLVRTGATVDQLRAMSPELIGYVQLCDGLLAATAADYTREGAFDRLAPGEGEFPLREILALVPDGQPLSIEVPTASLQARGIDAATRAAHVVASTRLLLSSCPA